MDKLFLLDAYALIYRAYYALIDAPRINSKGFNTSAVFGFINTLQEVINKEHPTHIGVAFDPKGETFRHKIYKEYKAQREETPEVIRASVPIIKDILRAYKIPILEVEGFEADDVIGTLSKKADEKGIDTYMMTPDKDYCQLVTDKARIFKPLHRNNGFDILGPQEVLNKYGITKCEQVIDLLGLMGDSSDNIPGCPGVGEKTAVKLILEFGGIDELLENTEQLKGALKLKVQTNSELIKLSKELATIRTDVPIELNMEELKFTGGDLEKLIKIFEELEFRSFINKMRNQQEVSSIEPRVKTTTRDDKNSGFHGDLFDLFQGESTENLEFSNLKGIKTVEHHYYLIDTQEKVKQLIEKISVSDFVCFDTETTGTEPLTAQIVGLSVSLQEHEAYYVVMPHDEEEKKNLLNLFIPIFENETTLKIGQNIKYDIEILGNYGVTVKGPLFDTMIAHYLIQPELRHNMDYLAEVYLGYKTIHIEELIGNKGVGQKNMADLKPSEIYEYACEDADITLQLYKILNEKLSESNFKPLFTDVEMPLVQVLAYMERNGVMIDHNSLSETSKLFTQRMKEIEQSIYQEAGGITFNILSPKQVGNILFDRLKIVHKPKKTKTGQYVTSEDVLESLRLEHPIVDLILQYRGLNKLLGTYIDTLPQLVNPKTGKLHTSYNQTVTATGRLSSSNPNLQNIPIRDENGKEVRKAFVPEPGCKFFSADYSQIELRVIAHMSGDENMIQDFKLGHDIHTATAAKVFNKPIEEVTKEERSKAKTANFGIIYGISPFGLAQRMGVSRTEAKELIDSYFKTYSGIKKYIDYSIESAREKGYIETLLKRRRYLPDINSHNATVRNYAERNAINAPIQGSAADIIKIAMIAIYNRFMRENIKSTMILQIHDELNFNVVPGEEEIVERIVMEEMQNAWDMSVPLSADCGWGENWLQAH